MALLRQATQLLRRALQQQQQQQQQLAQLERQQQWPLGARCLAGQARGREEPPAAGATVAMGEHQVQPLSKAVAQLERALLPVGTLPTVALQANLAALQKLKLFLSGLSSPTGYPPASIANVQFVLPGRGPGDSPARVRCQLKTTGGDCRRLVQTSLGQLLDAAGVNPYFYFDRDEFTPASAQYPRSRARPTAPTAPSSSSSSKAPLAPPTPQEVAAVRAQAAAAGFPSQTVSEEEFQAMSEQQEEARAAKGEAAAEAEGFGEQLQKVDPLFGAVAALPWLPDDEDGRQRAVFVRTRLLDELEALGWDIRGAARRIWGGERDLAALSSGKDSGSSAAIQGLLFHARRYDEQYGQKVLKV